MKESDFYTRIRPWLFNVGTPLRIENTVTTGTPDVILLYRATVFMLELKIMRRDKIIVRPFQLSTAEVYTKVDIPHDQYLFVCHSDEHIGVLAYTYQTIKRAPYVSDSKDKVVFNLSKIIPTHVWKSSADFTSWINSFNK